MNAPPPYGGPPPPYGGPPQAYGAPLPPPGFRPPAPPTDDASHLSVLAICHFVYSGFLGLSSLLGLVYVAIGIFFASSVFPTPPPTAHGAPGLPPELIGGFFAAVGGFITLFLGAQAVLVLVSGLALRKRRRRTLSFVAACICCMNVPLGTALGVFTLVVLSRASVKALYDQVAYYEG
jgi:hypothetical protein